MKCPCDLQKPYNECCEIYHKDKKKPENALQLMRSRYSAYALNLAPYIIQTTHPQNPNYQKNFKKWTLEILKFSKHTKFHKLEILSFEERDSISFVTFIAYLEQENKPVFLKEKSLFEKWDGIWLYKEAIL